MTDANLLNTNSPAGPQGTSFATSFAYTGCFGQTCQSTSGGAAHTCPGLGASYGMDSQAVTGGFNATLTSTPTNPAGRQCAILCQGAVRPSPTPAARMNYFGLVNFGTGSQVVCYCGVAITNSGGFFSESNCVPCNPTDPGGLGTCGVPGAGIAVYGRGF
jgi:hypothetical protein